MNLELIVNLLVGQVGEEKAIEIKEMILSLGNKMSTEDIYIIKKFPSKGVCLISTNRKDCTMSFMDGSTPKVTELERIVKDIEIG